MVLAVVLAASLSSRGRVDAYFSFNADSSRLLHRPTFMADLALPPTHPRFPSTALLHAICAVGSFYTAAVDPAPHPTKSPFPLGRLRPSHQGPRLTLRVCRRPLRRQALDAWAKTVLLRRVPSSDGEHCYLERLRRRRRADSGPARHGRFPFITSVSLTLAISRDYPWHVLLGFRKVSCTRRAAPSHG